MQTKNLTIMFTDMKGFTQRTSVGSRKQVERLLDIHNEIVKPVLRSYGGDLIKTIGDAFLVVFESPTDAVLCGMKIQESVANHNATAAADERFEIRIAINSGEVHLKDGDVFGEPVNVAARIQSIAEPAEVYFTEAVYLTMNKNEIPSSEVGQRHLKGIPEQIKVYKVLQEKTNLLRSQLKRKDLAQQSSSIAKEGSIAAMAASASAAPLQAANDTSPDMSRNTPSSSVTGKVITAIVITVLVIGLILAGLFILRGRRQRALQKPVDQVQQVPPQGDIKKEPLPVIENRVREKLEEEIRAKP